MRYTPALVLGTLAVAEASVQNIRHAGFHLRRQAGVKRDPIEYDVKDVNWSSVTYDFSTVDWSKVIGGNNKPAASTTLPVEEKKVEPTSVATSTSKPPPAPATTASESAPKPTTNKPSPSHGGSGGDGTTDGVAEWAKKHGMSYNEETTNKYSANEGNQIWLGSSDQQAIFTNEGSEDVIVVCWNKEGDGMTVNVHCPPIAIKIPVGGRQAVSFTPYSPAACAPVYSSTEINFFGAVGNTWAEINLGVAKKDFVGAFDVSKNVFMHGGSNISMKGSKCSSTMDTCFFRCKDQSADHCQYGYDLVNCDAGNGGGGGYDPNAQGIGGGCAAGDYESLEVTLSN